MAYYQKALQLNPTNDEVYLGLGAVSYQKGKPNESIGYYKKALQLNPNNANTHFNLGCTLLLSGNLKKGWREYEWRWQIKEHRNYNCFHRPSDFSQPLVNTTHLAGITVLIYAEQGLGDEIQFIRYASLLDQCGANVIIECHRELYTLFQSVKHIKQCIAQGQALPNFDMQCPLLTLPFIFDTTLDNIPAKVPYLTVNPTLIQKWQERIPKDYSKLKVGLVWSGNPKNIKLKYKSFPLDTFMPLLKLDNVVFYSLQKGKASEQSKNLPQGTQLVDLADEICDFSDTASLIQILDLVVSVDTAVAHLAGALGKPVWTLLPFMPDWRWMLNREDTPWYPTMRLFRQPSIGDWESVITNVRRELEKKTAAIKNVSS
jgi:hypothetical protein